jgi:tRNA pseudouridine55 synthase
VIECSSGTYVRSLIADLSDAYCEELRRTEIGPFSVSDAVAPPPRGVVWEDPPLRSKATVLEALKTSHGLSGALDTPPLRLVT